MASYSESMDSLCLHLSYDRISGLPHHGPLINITRNRSQNLTTGEYEENDQRKMASFIMRSKRLRAGEKKNKNLETLNKYQKEIQAAGGVLDVERVGAAS